MDALAAYDSGTETDSEGHNSAEQATLLGYDNPVLVPQTEEFGTNSASSVEEHAADGPAAKQRKLYSHQTAQAPVKPALDLPNAAFLLAEDTDIATLDHLAHRHHLLRHKGRVRTAPHVPGNFATAVMIPVCFNRVLHTAINTMFWKIKESLPALELIENPGMSPEVMQLVGQQHNSLYHVSMSRTVGITKEQIQPLVKQLQQVLQDCASFSFTVNGCKVFVNDEKTRTFLALHVTEGTEQICALIKEVDAVLVNFNLPPFHQVPDPHVSIAWVLGDKRHKLQSILDSIAETQVECTVPVHAIVCRVGQKDHVLWRQA